MNAMEKHGTQKSHHYDFTKLNTDVWQTKDSCLLGCCTMQSGEVP
jgi:hypothetical protein